MTRYAMLNLAIRFIALMAIGALATVIVAWWPGGDRLEDSVVSVDAVTRGPLIYGLTVKQAPRKCELHWELLAVTSETFPATDAERTKLMAQCRERAKLRPWFLPSCGFDPSRPRAFRKEIGSELVRFGHFATEPGADKNKDFEGTNAAAGWPCLALWFDDTDTYGNQPGLSRKGDYILISRGVPYFGGAELPLRPIWSGLATNTTFFAVAAWLTVRVARLSFRSVRWLWRWNRSRRGLCPRCAYDLRGLNSPTCPECGAARSPAQPIPASSA